MIEELTAFFSLHPGTISHKFLWWQDSKIDYIWRMKWWNKRFFACWCMITKIKSWSKFFGWAFAKNGCGQSGHGTLKLTVSRKWTDEIKWFFSWWYRFRKAKSWFNDFWVGVVRNGHGFFSSWDPKIYCIWRTNLWIELVFGMLTLMQ